MINGNEGGLNFSENESGLNLNENIEDVSKNLKDQEGQSQCVSLKNLRKVYGSGKQAVKGLNLTMYKG